MFIIKIMNKFLQDKGQAIADWFEVRRKKNNYTRLTGKIFEQRSWLERKVDDAIFESNKRVR